MMTKQRLEWCLEAVLASHGTEEAEALRVYVTKLEDIKVSAEELQSVTDGEYCQPYEVVSAKEDLQIALNKLTE